MEVSGASKKKKQIKEEGRERNGSRRQGEKHKIMKSSNRQIFRQNAFMKEIKSSRKMHKPALICCILNESRL